MRRSGTRSPRPCARGTPTPCRSCWHCRSSAGWTATLRGSRARWSGDPQARAAVAVGGRPGAGGGRAARGGRVALRKQHDRDASRGGGPVQERRGARSGAHGGVVLPGRGAEPRGRPHRGPHGVRARGRARAGEREGAVRLRHRARSAEPPGRRDADVPPLAGGRGQVIRVVVDDLAFLASDAIVRPATTRLDPTTPVVRRLEQVGGKEFVGRLQVHKDLAVGSAVVTGGGGDLPAEFVIHAVIRSDTEPVSPTSVARAWLSALHQAQEWEFAHLTVPPLGIGAGNLSIEAAAEIMVTVLKVHAENAAYPSSVSIVVESPEDREAFEGALRRAGSAES